MNHLSKNKCSVYSQLQRGKMREKHNLFAVEGWKSVVDTLPYFDLEAVVVRDDISSDELAKVSGLVAAERLFEATEGDMKKMSAFTTSASMMAVYRLPAARSGFTPAERGKLYLMLDGVRDPGNLGTIVRTAHWFGIDRIYASRDTVDIYNPKTIQSTMGSLGRVEVEYGDLAELIAAAPELPVFGTLLNGENIYKAELANEGFIVMGNEGTGISEPLRPLVTSPLLIPPFNPNNHSESLNVAIATAVTLSQFRARGR